VKNGIRTLTTGGVVAALYIALTGVFAPISFSGMQFRVSEVLVLLPVLTPAAIPGVALGCLLSNLLFGGLGIVDIVFGTLATLLAAIGTRLLRRWTPLAPVPPIVLNGLVVGTYLPMILPDYHVPIWLSMLSVAAGETAVLFVVGLPLVYLLQRIDARHRLFPEDRR
jgi:uncharacterized membrane protein